jgi:hypothetical protein
MGLPLRHLRAQFTGRISDSRKRNDSAHTPTHDSASHRVQVCDSVRGTTW